MQATMRLDIFNKETMNVLNRALPNNDNYFERVCVKIGLLIKDSLLGNAFALVSLYQLHDEILNLSACFDDEADKFEGQIEKKNILSLSKVNFVAQYGHDMPCGNALSCALYELIEVFDRLISRLKLLHLSGLLESRAAFYQLKEDHQKKLNALLSKIIQTPSSKNHSTTVSELIENPDNFNTSQICPHTLKEALDAPYAPGFSPQVLSNLKYKLKSHISKNNKTCMEV
ncbi:AcaB family transcriptional regulator [Legionella israelensis]|uniref:Uncharacterized protein n=1 Tax=Legionella israelensis TaxID=454 RepID=A0A0W0WAR0_9GAMM|nr:AcaB family transcriptional regulator [Legionella israelensis]KTD29331.1 hypothetical protein Lisr_0839 [Legionella israelensis]QBS11242.1 DUF1845 domain-containing protein [Legionella israelensis]SCY46933.1 protein of unknown function [Legionella israelensis DSM 19235]STX61073.1 Uncharacterised protein [Legionella israelensis]